MPLDFTKKTISTSKCLNFSNQSLIENNILIPDSKPDIKKIIRVNSNVTDLSAKTSEGEVILEGTLSETLLYIGENSTLPFYSVKESVDFKENIVTPDVTPTMRVFVSPEIEFIEHNILNERKVNVKNVVNFHIFTFSNNMTETLLETNDPNIQSLTSEKSFSKPIDIIHETINITEEIHLPQKKPDIEEIISWDASICSKDIRVMNGKLQIKGNLCMEILYTSDYENPIPELLKTELPFSGFIDNQNSSENLQVFGNLYPKNVYLRAINNSDGNPRTIEADISIVSDLVLTENTNETIIEDAYSLSSPISAQSEDVSFSNILPTASTVFTVSDTVTLNENLPSFLQILNVGSYITLDETAIEENKVTIDGDILLEVLYVGKDDLSPFNIFDVNIPFRQETVIEGAKPGQVAYITSNVENIVFNLLTDREAEFNVTSALEITLIENDLASFLTEITESEENDSMSNLSSATIYITQPGDSLWKIAKRFGTTIDSLVELNSIENPDLIYPGQRLLITRKILFD